MATPFEHAHVSHVSRMGRRRSQSLTTPNSNEKDATGMTRRQVRLD